MSKLKAALLSLRASGSIKNLLSFDNRLGQRRVRKKPEPVDPKTAAQLSWRHMYQKAAALWHDLSSSEQAAWESSARPKHMTGFAYFMSQCLRPNPGIYLPLQGGIMQGDIDMATFKITDLPAPIAVTEPTRLTELNAHIAAPFVHIEHPQKLKPALNRYVIPGWLATVRATYTVTAGRIYYTPIFVEETTTYIRICIFVSGTSVGTADLRIFNWTNGLPSSLVLSAGTVNTGTTEQKEIVISQVLNRRYYFLAIRCTGTPEILSLAPYYAICPPIAGLNTTPLVDPSLIILAADAPYADPAPAPTLAFNPSATMVHLKEN